MSDTDPEYLEPGEPDWQMLAKMHESDLMMGLGFLLEVESTCAHTDKTAQERIDAISHAIREHLLFWPGGRHNEGKVLRPVALVGEEEYWAATVELQTFRGEMS